MLLGLLSIIHEDESATGSKIVRSIFTARPAVVHELTNTYPAFAEALRRDQTPSTGENKSGRFMGSFAKRKALLHDASRPTCA